MAIRFKFDGVNVTLSKIERIQTELVEGVTAKMTELMNKLHAKIISQKLPSSGVLDANVSEPEISYTPGVVRGSISWLGGPPGDKYAINPIGKEGARTGIRELAGGRKVLAEHGRNKITRSGQDVLHFIASDGKEVWAPQVFHQYFPGPTKMTEALDEMQDEIRAGLEQTIQGIKLG